MPIISKETKDYIPPKVEILIAKKETLRTGDKYKVTDSIMTHLIGKVVTIKNFKYISKGVKFYDVTIDSMNNCPLVCSDKVLEKI